MKLLQSQHPEYIQPQEVEQIEPMCTQILDFVRNPRQFDILELFTDTSFEVADDSISAGGITETGWESLRRELKAGDVYIPQNLTIIKLTGGVEWL